MNVPGPDRLREMAAELVALADELEGRGLVEQGSVQQVRAAAGIAKVRRILAEPVDPEVNQGGIDRAREAVQRRGDGPEVACPSSG